MRKIALGLAAAVLLTSNVAFAAPEAVHVTDPCGDADRMARVSDVAVPTPDAARAAAFDVKAAWFEDVYEGSDLVGVRVNLQLCGAVPAPELVGSFWDVTWQISEDCTAGVTLVDTVDVEDPSTGVQRGARLDQGCASTGPGTVPGSSTTTFRTEWITVLEADEYSVSGDTVTWLLTPDMIGVGPTSIEFLSPEATWTAPHAATRDARWGTQIGDGALGVHVNGPGARDLTDPGTAFTVGASQP